MSRNTIEELKDNFVEKVTGKKESEDKNWFEAHKKAVLVGIGSVLAIGATIAGILLLGKSEQDFVETEEVVSE